MKKKFCHLVVGFSIFEYFKNILDSILDLDGTNDIILITTGNPKFFGWGGVLDFEFKENIKIKKYVEYLKIKKKINIFYYEIKKDNFNNKVGSLYNAYNLGLKIAKKNKVDYLNIMQNDMQLMMWTPGIESTVIELFKKHKKVFFVGTGFLRKCVNSDINKNFIIKVFKSKYFKKKKEILISKNNAVGDWGIFDLKKMDKINFSFRKNENFLSKNLHKKGFYSILIPIPFVATLPWPAVIRKGKIYGSVLQLNNKKYLKLNQNMSEKKIFKLKLPWTENCIKPNGWWALEPNWVTDLNFFEYVRSLKNYKKNFGHFPTIQFSNGNLKRKFYPPSIFDQYRPNLISFLIKYPYYFCIRLIKKIIL